MVESRLTLFAASRTIVNPEDRATIVELTQRLAAEGAVRDKMSSQVMQLTTELTDCADQIATLKRQVSATFCFWFVQQRKRCDGTDALMIIDTAVASNCTAGETRSRGGRVCKGEHPDQHETVAAVD